jgi:hypothetical protein
MKRSILTSLAVVALFAMAVAVNPIMAAGLNGVDVTCDTGANIYDGVEVVVNMRPGYTYTATAIGIGDFDPVLAVLDANGNGLCTDDDADASYYNADLPTTGFVSSSSLSSQINFSPDTYGLSDISLVVGDYAGDSGEFVLVLEGMAVTPEDGSGYGAGDPYYVRVTQNMLNSGVPITAYMISLDSELDPYLTIVDGSNSPLMVCDDAGSQSCDGQSASLNGYSVSTVTGSQLGGYQYDAMLQYDLYGTRLNSNPNENYLSYLMTSYNQSTFGHYLVAFHMGVNS